jgi:cytochrome c oxidase assembly factor CtaG
VAVANVVWLFWAFPGPFDLAWRDGAVGLAQHATYLAGGVLFWLQVFGSRPLRPAAPVLRRVALVSGTVAATTVLGMVLVFSAGALYAIHAGPAHRVMTVLDDQQLAGAVWWMGALPALMTVGVALLIQWLNNEDAAQVSAGLDRLITPRKYAWPSRPVIR